LPIPWLLRGAGLSLAALLALSPLARAMLRAALVSPLAFALGAAALAWLLSLGPHPHVGGQPFGSSRIFLRMYDLVPGFDGLRVPARFAMVVVLFLSFAAAWGVRDLLRTARRRAGLVAAALVVLWLAESWSAPFPVNAPIGSDLEGVLSPPARVAAGQAPPLARALRRLPPGSVVIAFPFGVTAWEMRYVYESTFHWRPLVNGFSGYFPDSYVERVQVLREPHLDPEAAWQAVVDSGATHAVVYGQAFVTRQPPAPYDWLQEHGATPVERVGTDEIYRIPRQPSSGPSP
jgi:hypothetical protein